MFLKMICQHCLTGCPLATVDNTSHLCLKGIVFTSNFWNFNFGETFSRKLVSAWKRPKPTGQVWVYHICGWMDSYQHMIERENINPSNDWKNINHIFSSHSIHPWPCFFTKEEMWPRIYRTDSLGISASPLCSFFLSPFWTFPEECRERERHENDN